MTLVTVAIINFNTRERLRACLASLAAFPGPAQRTMVIDNASGDGSAAMVRQEFGDRVELIANRTNLGFARAINQALQRSRTPYLLVLNADIEVRGQAIAALCQFMAATPDAGVAGGKLLDSQGAIQPSCRRFYTATAILLRRTPLGRLLPRHPGLRQHLMLDWDHGEIRRVDWLQGACLMLRRSAVERVGALDERFFLYFEDVDLCRRLSAAGWGVYYVPHAEFIHHYRRASHGGLSREKLHHLLSALRYLEKWQLRPRWVALHRWLAPAPPPGPPPGVER